ncbi:MAG: hypothetical protein ABFD70_11315 [Syntrophaceae bacterium]|nr:hypothetical protein [Deltaproteobacteria bacterium]
MKKVMSLIAVLALVCFATMVFAAGAPKADAAKAAPVASDVAKPAPDAAKGDVAAPADKDLKVKKAAKKAPAKKVSKKKAAKKVVKKAEPEKTAAPATESK